MGLMVLGEAKVLKHLLLLGFYFLLTVIKVLEFFCLSSNDLSSLGFFLSRVGLLPYLILCSSNSLV